MINIYSLDDKVCLICSEAANDQGKTVVLQGKKFYLCQKHHRAFYTGLMIGQMELPSKLVNYISEMDENLTANELKEKLYTLVPNARRQVEKNQILEIKEQTPRELYDALESNVIGQDLAKSQISLSVFKHVRSLKRKSNTNASDSHGILLLGPSGSGKTLIANTIAKSLKLPFVAVDATSYSPTGYQGADADTMISDLLLKANGNVALAEKGIIFIDEIDKMSTHYNQGNRGEALNIATQSSLLKLIEGKKVKVPGQLLGEPQGTFIQVDTSKILFFLGGAFPGLSEIVAKISGYSGPKIGFNQNNSNQEFEKAIRTYEILSKADTETLIQALIQYGLSTELVGRIPVIAPLAPLTKEELRMCLLELNHSPMQREIKLFAECGYLLEFDDDFIDEVVNKAYSMSTGARALNTIISKSVSKAAFELLGGMINENKGRILITKECINNPSEYKYESLKKQIDIEYKGVVEL